MDSKVAGGVDVAQKFAARTDTALAGLFAAQSLQEGTGLLYNDR